MSASTISLANSISTSYEQANTDQLVEKTWAMAKSLLFWYTCLLGCLIFMGASFNGWTVSVFFQAVFVAWLLYQKRWYVIARYYVFIGASTACLMMIMRFGTDSYAYFVLVPMVLGILSSFKTKHAGFGISFSILACASYILYFGYTFDFVAPIESPERYRLLFILITIGLCYDMTGGFLEKNREFRIRMKGMLRQLEERETNLQLNCREEEIQVQKFELNNKKLEAVIQNRILMERGLSSSNEQLSQFSYAASHDLKEPLRSINSFIQLIQRKVVNLNDEVLEKHTGEVISSSTKMTKLLDDLLEYSRSSKTDQALAVVDLNKAVNSALYTFQTVLDSIDASVTVLSLPTVLADRKSVEQLFSKLLSNAIENREEERPLEIRISQGEVINGMVEILVSDNGIGIEPHLRNDVFILFNRGAKEKETDGSGLGLSTCRKIIESHGGQIKFTSNEDDIGITCQFTIPTSSQSLN